MDQFILDKQRFIESNESNGKEKYLLTEKKYHQNMHYYITYGPPKMRNKNTLLGA